MRIVLDTNVFISGIFWEGNFCSQIIDKWRTGEFELISSPETIQELIETLKCFKIKLDEELIESWRNIIIENSVIVEISKSLELIKEDPEDNKFISTAMSGKADFIISQDKHLLKVRAYQAIKIIEPKEFLDLINNQ